MEIALEARSVTAGYGQQAKVIEALCLGIKSGTFTVLAGPNGSGKSTLLKALAGFLPLTEGAVELQGAPVSSFSAKRLAQLVGILPQGPSAPEGLSVEDLVRQGRYPHRGLFSRWTPQDTHACRAALDLTGLADLAERPLDSLSGGQKQRAWIAMVLAQQTPVLLLDEPTTFLDIAHQVEILSLLRRLVKENGRTVVAVLHDINQAAQYADRLVLLKGGRVKAEGDTRSVVTGEAMDAVFGVRSQVITNPVDGTPLMLLESDL
ncbi:ABC transporter ATP-binding protein [Labrenzia aggregata]|uniref:ABC transporter ATP-binding protein n=2 Tax=Roseibium aggregatum TaxID=187304 RepID=A0A939EH96_9HYPH|nr:ABC transporter ATP-binding protein [Roseibium aggregatum]